MAIQIHPVGLGVATGKRGSVIRERNDLSVRVGGPRPWNVAETRK